MRLKGKTAVITGAAHGIGRATAQVFARQGAELSLWDVDEEKGQELADELNGQGTRALFGKVDVSQAEACQEAADQAWSSMGKIDILINNAGILRDATLLKMTPDQWRQVVDVNLKGVFNAAQAVARRMVEQGTGGCILNASSVVALYGNFGQSNYVAAKAGVIGLSKTWARELGRKGIRVNAVAPGFIATEMVESIPQEVMKQALGRIPLGRMGQPEDVANLYLFLASDEAAYINGAVISIDGGMVG
ncbi:MAG TPA: 3-oxoacyl-ACP reductase FabG [Acidobacteriota bacterium]|nr:3-oxoacyl-ACP reductase FabG [Acidobacteriota bacterium]